jgi:hypothetical protein
MTQTIGNRAMAAARQWAAGYAKEQALSPMIEERLTRAFVEGISWYQQETISQLNQKQRRRKRA